MNYAKSICVAVAVLALCLPCSLRNKPQAVAQEKSEYIGSEKCAVCHSDISKKWALTTHRATMFNKDESKRGCEGCHGPGSKHVAGGGDTEWIVRFQKLKPKQITDICIKCHTQEKVTLWQTSPHARGKVSCINCHDPHSEGAPVLLKSIENGKLDLETLTRAIQAGPALCEYSKARQQGQRRG